MRQEKKRIHPGLTPRWMFNALAVHQKQRRHYEYRSDESQQSVLGNGIHDRKYRLQSAQGIARIGQNLPIGKHVPPPDQESHRA